MQEKKFTHRNMDTYPPLNQRLLSLLPSITRLYFQKNEQCHV